MAREMKIGGLPVVDATSDVILTITAGDIKSGDARDPGTCAAAQACMRQLHCSAALVHMGRVYVKTKKHWVRYETPPAMRSEMIAFDRRKSFKPGQYYLRPPYRKATGKMQGTKTNQTGKKAKKKKEKLPRHFIDGVRTSALEYTING